jgi:hypothetical protein
VAAAGALAVLFVTALTGMAWVVTRPPASEKAGPETCALAPLPEEIMAQAVEPVLQRAPAASPAPAVVAATPAEPAPPPETLAVVASALDPGSIPATEHPLAPRACEKFGTSVEFVTNPLDAGRQAARDHKLLFVLHLSGNFEDNRFT